MEKGSISLVRVTLYGKTADWFHSDQKYEKDVDDARFTSLYK